jgi:hypothetical protein
MTNTKMLREKIALSGYKLQYIAEQIGITYQGFLKKLNNESEFKASEIKIIQTVLGLSKKDRDAIFFYE